MYKCLYKFERDGGDVAEASFAVRLRAALEAIDAGIAAALLDLGLADYRPRFSAIVRVLARDGAANISELAAATGVTHSAASQTVNELRLRGLVTLARGHDERSRVVSLAPNAHELLPAIEAEWAATAAALTALDTELSVALPTIAAELAAALERRPFRQRIAEAAQLLADQDVGEFRTPLARSEPAPEAANAETG
jgi:DNA-binding MarR family transcriptional regulator